MSTAAMTHRLELPSLADTAFRAAATVIGQLVFLLAVASFYGLTALRGDFHSWSRFLTRGWVRGDGLGNLALAMPVGSAVAVMLAGTVQLIPRVRDRFPRFHRHAYRRGPQHGRLIYDVDPGKRWRCFRAPGLYMKLK